MIIFIQVFFSTQFLLTCVEWPQCCDRIWVAHRNFGKVELYSEATSKKNDTELLPTFQLDMNTRCHSGNHQHHQHRALDTANSIAASVLSGNLKELPQLPLIISRKKSDSSYWCISLAEPTSCHTLTEREPGKQKPGILTSIWKWACQVRSLRCWLALKYARQILLRDSFHCLKSV